MSMNGIGRENDVSLNKCVDERNREGKWRIVKQMCRWMEWWRVEKQIVQWKLSLQVNKLPPNNNPWEILLSKTKVRLLKNCLLSIFSHSNTLNGPLFILILQDRCSHLLTLMLQDRCSHLLSFILYDRCSHLLTLILHDRCSHLLTLILQDRCSHLLTLILQDRCSHLLTLILQNRRSHLLTFNM